MSRPAAGSAAALRPSGAEMTEGGLGLSVVLRFRDAGPAYERAKAVADAMGLSIEDYLLRCVAEGHKLLRGRHLPDPDLELETPTFERWGVPLNGR